MEKCGQRGLSWIFNFTFEIEKCTACTALQLCSPSNIPAPTSTFRPPPSPLNISQYTRTSDQVPRCGRLAYAVAFAPTLSSLDRVITRFLSPYTSSMRLIVGQNFLARSDGRG